MEIKFALSLSLSLSSEEIAQGLSGFGKLGFIKQNRKGGTNPLEGDAKRRFPFPAEFFLGGNSFRSNLVLSLSLCLYISAWIHTNVHVIISIYLLM